MGTESDQARSIAERIARRVSQEAASEGLAQVNNDLTSELADMRATLGDLQRRLGQIEAKFRSSPGERNLSANQQPSAPLRVHSPWLAGLNSPAAHPSEERFGVEEAAVTELVDYFQNEKHCTVEPGGKPCDHCAMCSSRGF